MESVNSLLHWKGYPSTDKEIEQLKSLTDEWIQEYQQQKQAAQQAQQQNPAAMKAQIDMAKLQQQEKKAQSEFQLDMARLQQDERKVLADLQLGHQSANVQIVKAMTEQFAKQVDLELKGKDMKHRHFKEAFETHNKIRNGHEGRKQT